MPLTGYDLRALGLMQVWHGEGEVDWDQLLEGTIHAVKGLGLDPAGDGKAVKD